jgi:hypothetical protein
MNLPLITSSTIGKAQPSDEFRGLSVFQLSSISGTLAFISLNRQQTITFEVKRWKMLMAGCAALSRPTALSTIS